MLEMIPTRDSSLNSLGFFLISSISAENKWIRGAFGSLHAPWLASAQLFFGLFDYLADATFLHEPFLKEPLV
jgi:hypothetical protein